jgi:hypothetical protein
MPRLARHWQSIRTHALQRLRHLSAQPDLPAEPRADDLYLVEFPKSGVTWLSFLVANTNLLLSGDEARKVTFFNLNDFVPDIEVNRRIGPPATLLPGFRVIKSHAGYNVFYSKMVYLVRDPRDVMASYRLFLTRLGFFTGSLDEMLADPRFGIGAWCDHVSSWLDRALPSQSFILLRYEDLLRDTAGQLRQLYRLLGFDLSEGLAALAVERSGIERMREEEVLANARHPALANFEFVRKGAAGGPRESLSPAALGRIARVAGPLMERLGYPSDRA